MMKPQTVRAALSFAHLVLLAGCFAIVAFIPMPHEAKDVLLVLLGAIIALNKDSSGFFFATSQSSADKNELFAHRPNGTVADPVRTEEITTKGNDYA